MQLNSLGGASRLQIANWLPALHTESAAIWPQIDLHSGCNFPLAPPTATFASDSRALGARLTVDSREKTYTPSKFAVRLIENAFCRVDTHRQTSAAYTSDAGNFFIASIPSE